MLGGLLGTRAIAGRSKRGRTKQVDHDQSADGEPGERAQRARSAVRQLCVGEFGETRPGWRLFAVRVQRLRLDRQQLQPDHGHMQVQIRRGRR